MTISNICISYDKQGQGRRSLHNQCYQRIDNNTPEYLLMCGLIDMIKQKREHEAMQQSMKKIMEQLNKIKE